MKLYFCLLHLKCILHVSCTFSCAVLITGLVVWTSGGLGFSVAPRETWDTFVFCTSSFFSRDFLIVFFKTFLFFLLGLTKTIHVNITSFKNVYFYDFWVSTLSFANKIFNDSLPDFSLQLYFWYQKGGLSFCNQNRRFEISCFALYKQQLLAC